MQHVRKFAWLVAVIVGLSLVGVAVAASPSQVRDVGDESHELMESMNAFIEPRAAPAETAPSAAWLPAVRYAKTVKAANSTAWTEVGPKNYFTDDPNYAD